MNFNSINEKVDFLKKEGYVVGCDVDGWFYELDEVDKIYGDWDSLEKVVDDVLFCDFEYYK